MAWPRQILDTLVSCRPEYTNKLLKNLNYLVTNPSSPIFSSSKGLGDDSKISCGHKKKNKPFCVNKRLSDSLVEEEMFQQDSYFCIDSMKPSFSTLHVEVRGLLQGHFDGATKSYLSILDDNTGVAANVIFKQIQKKQELQEQMKEIKPMLNTSEGMKRKQHRLQNQLKDIEPHKQRNWRM